MTTGDTRSIAAFSRGDSSPVSSTKHGCTCPISPRSSWVVVHWRCNYSAFNGYRHTISNYSLVSCLKCHRSWRTKAAYVNSLQVLTGTQVSMWSRGTLITGDLA